MLMVVMLHVLWHGGVSEGVALQKGDFSLAIVRLLHTTCVCAVDCFILATGAVMWNKGFKLSRIVTYWAGVVFYSLCITALFSFFILRVDGTWKDWIKSILPVARNQYWFFTSYVALFFTMPFLNTLIANIEQGQLKKHLIGGFVLLSVYPTLEKIYFR